MPGGFNCRRDVCFGMSAIGTPTRLDNRTFGPRYRDMYLDSCSKKLRLVPTSTPKWSAEGVSSRLQIKNLQISNRSTGKTPRLETTMKGRPSHFVNPDPTSNHLKYGDSWPTFFVRASLELLK